MVFEKNLKQKPIKHLSSYGNHFVLYKIKKNNKCLKHKSKKSHNYKSK